MGEDAAHGNAPLAVFFELEGTGKDLPVVVELSAFHFHGHGLPCLALQSRFVIEGIQVGDPAGHIAEDDALGLPWFFQRVVEWRFGEQLLALAIIQQTGQCQHSESTRALLEHAAT